MRKPVAFVSTIAAASLFSLAPSAEAEQTSFCPDGMVLVPAALVEQGEKKDRNANGFVCGKFQDGKVVGGPDENLTDDILV